MKTIIFFMSLLVLHSQANQMLPGTFKTVHYYKNNQKIMEKRINECEIMTEMTFAIEKDCSNAKKAKLLMRHKKIDLTKNYGKAY